MNSTLLHYHTRLQHQNKQKKYVMLVEVIQIFLIFRARLAAVDYLALYLLFDTLTSVSLVFSLCFHCDVFQAGITFVTHNHMQCWSSYF